jgi:XapX domain-containing protein
MNWKLLVGIALGFCIGLGCRALGIPSPAPPVLVGSLLVVAMTTGYVLTDAFLAKRRAEHFYHCGGPTGQAHKGVEK